MLEKEISRRDFLHKSILALLGLCAACSKENPEEATTVDPGNLERKLKLEVKLKGDMNSLLFDGQVLIKPRYLWHDSSGPRDPSNHRFAYFITNMTSQSMEVQQINNIFLSEESKIFRSDFLPSTGDDFSIPSKHTIAIMIPAGEEFREPQKVDIEVIFGDGAKRLFTIESLTKNLLEVDHTVLYGELNPQKLMSIRLLTDDLRSPSAEDRLFAARYLREMGSDAKIALPRLRILAQSDPDKRVSKAAEVAYDKISDDD